MKKLMILGAGMLQTFVIKRAHDMGIFSVAADMDENAVGFRFADEKAVVNIVDEAACLDYARRVGIDGVLTAATDYGVLAASTVSQQLGLRGLPYAVARTVKNKYEVRRAVNDIYNGNFQFFEITHQGELCGLKDKIQFPVMVKPCDGSGSKGAGRADGFDALTVQCKEAFSKSLCGRVLIESFVTGQEYGVESFVCDGKVYVLAVMKKYMTAPPYYAELGHSYPCGLCKELEGKIISTAENIIKILGITFGSVNMDILLTEQGIPYVVDIGARMGGNLIGSHIIPYGTGIDYIGNMIKAHLGEETDFSSDRKQIVSTAILALTEGRIRSLPDFEKLRKQPNVIDIVFNKRIGDTIRTYKNNLDGCGYVVTTGNTEAEAHELAFSLRDEIDRAIERE